MNTRIDLDWDEKIVDCITTTPINAKYKNNFTDWYVELRIPRHTPLVYISRLINHQLQVGIVRNAFDLKAFKISNVDKNEELSFKLSRKDIDIKQVIIPDVIFENSMMVYNPAYDNPDLVSISFDDLSGVKIWVKSLNIKNFDDYSKLKIDYRIQVNADNNVLNLNK